MSRRPRRIPVKATAKVNTSQEESVEDVLASIDSLQEKQRAIAPKTDVPLPMAKIFSGIVIISILGFAVLALGNLPTLTNTGGSNLENSNLTELDFKIQLLDESEVWLSDYEGAPIILDLFATWCGPCKTQIVELQSIKTAFPSVKIISVTVDLNDDIASLITYKDDNNMNWIVGRDVTSRGGQVFSATSIPTLAFFNSAGELKQYNQGVVYYNTLVNWITEG